MERFSKEWWADFAKKAAQDKEEFPLVGRPTGELLRVFDLREMRAAQWQELEVLSQDLRDQGKEIAPEELLQLLVHGVFLHVEKQGTTLLKELVQQAEAAE